MLRVAVFSVLVSALPALADTVVATRTIRAQSILTAQDLVLKDEESPGAATSLDQVIGKETRVALYAGTPIHQGDVGPPAVVERNQIVRLIFERDGLRIVADGRSLSRARPGERIRVMNMSSRATVTGRVGADGRVTVSN